MVRIFCSDGIVVLEIGVIGKGRRISLKRVFPKGDTVEMMPSKRVI